MVYTYGTTNNNGSILSVGYTGGGLSNTQNFSYDSLNRLDTAQENSGSSWSQINGYDRYANRWVVGSGLTFNTNNRISNAGYTYDSSGNMTSDGYNTYTYDAEGHIKTAANPSTTYTYDGSGQRVRKVVSGENVRFVYGLGGELLAEFDGSSGNLKKEYV